jgi:hypothetical protein
METGRFPITYRFGRWKCEELSEPGSSGGDPGPPASAMHRPREALWPASARISVAAIPSFQPGQNCLRQRDDVGLNRCRRAPVWDVHLDGQHM